MKRKMTRLFAVLLCAAMLLSVLPFSAFAFDIDPPFHVDGKSVSSLADAFDKAADSGSVITQDGKTADYQAVASGIAVTKNVTLALGKDDFNSNVNRIEYTGKAAPLFTVKNGAVLTIRYSAISGNTNAENLRGGLIRVEKGGTLILDGTAAEPVVISDCKLTAQDAKGGAIYAEKGGKVIVNGVTFTGNSAASGKDIYAEQKSDVTIKSGITADFGYYEEPEVPEKPEVDINGLNLVLTGEIGLVFHTVVPEKYLDGTFVLTSRTGGTVTYQIRECEKDSAGRYLAEYDLSAIELSEPVTLTVYGKNGDELASKAKSAEDYGKVILADGSAAQKEKNVVKALLNYGHFAQLECAQYDGWKIGSDYAETPKYANLSTADSVFNSFAYTMTGHDAEVPNIGVQLSFDYKTDVILYFPSAQKPTVTVNNQEVTVEKTEKKGYHYCVTIRGISALELGKQYTVKINGNIVLKLSAMSYCKLAIAQRGNNCKNAVKALYEFYCASVSYNA